MEDDNHEKKTQDSGLITKKLFWFQLKVTKLLFSGLNRELKATISHLAAGNQEEPTLLRASRMSMLMKNVEDTSIMRFIKR